MLNFEFRIGEGIAHAKDAKGARSGRFRSKGNGL